MRTIILSALTLVIPAAAVADPVAVTLPKGTIAAPAMPEIYIEVPPDQPTTACTMRAPGLTRTFTVTHTTIAAVYLRFNPTMRTRTVRVHFSCTEGSRSQLTVRALRTSKRAPRVPVSIAGIDASTPANVTVS